VKQVILLAFSCQQDAGVPIKEGIYLQSAYHQDNKDFAVNYYWLGIF
jgi:hypothetical protein